MCCRSRSLDVTRPCIVTVVRQLRRRTAGLLQSLDNGLVGLYADLSLGPRCLVRCAGQIRLGLLQVGLGSLKIETNNKKINKPKEKKAETCHSEKPKGGKVNVKALADDPFPQRKNKTPRAGPVKLHSAHPKNLRRPDGSAAAATV